jgi:hypothetical protein
MVFDGKLVVQFEPGTVIVDPESGRRYRVNEITAVVQNNVLYVTPERYELLKAVEEAMAESGGGDSSGTP